MKSATEILQEYKHEVETELEKFLPRHGEPPEFYESVWELLDRGGKRFRPALTYLACEAVGGKRRDATPAAAAVELLHNMTLIHDDVEDRSELRRGKPCLHILYGEPVAINTGDAMLIKVFEIANSAEISEDRRRWLIEIFAKRAYNVTWGQALEFSMWKRKHFTEDDVIKILRFKTGALTRLPVEAGAISGGGTQTQVESLGEFGEMAGVAFQIQDDLLNVTGDVREYGKEIGGDIREGKKTLMAAHLLRTASQADKKAFWRILGKTKVTASETKKAISLYKKYGSIDYARKKAREHLNTAISLLDVLPKSEAKDNLVEVSNFLLSRSF